MIHSRNIKDSLIIKEKNGCKKYKNKEIIAAVKPIRKRRKNSLAMKLHLLLN